MLSQKVEKKDATQVCGEKHRVGFGEKIERIEIQEFPKVVHVESMLTVEEFESNIDTLEKKKVALKKEAKWLLYLDVNDKVLMEEFWKYKMTGHEELLFNILKKQDQLLLGDDAKPAIQKCVDRTFSELKELEKKVSAWNQKKADATPGSWSLAVLKQMIVHFSESKTEVALKMLIERAADFRLLRLFLLYQQRPNYRPPTFRVLCSRHADEFEGSDEERQVLSNRYALFRRVGRAGCLEHLMVELALNHSYVDHIYLMDLLQANWLSSLDFDDNESNRECARRKDETERLVRAWRAYKDDQSLSARACLFGVATALIEDARERARFIFFLCNNEVMSSVNYILVRSILHCYTRTQPSGNIIAGAVGLTYMPRMNLTDFWLHEAFDLLAEDGAGPLAAIILTNLFRITALRDGASSRDLAQCMTLDAMSTVEVPDEIDPFVSFIELPVDLVEAGAYNTDNDNEGILRAVQAALDEESVIICAPAA